MNQKHVSFFRCCAWRGCLTLCLRVPIQNMTESAIVLVPVQKRDFRFYNRNKNNCRFGYVLRHPPKTSHVYKQSIWRKPTSVEPPRNLQRPPASPTRPSRCFNPPSLPLLRARPAPLPHPSTSFPCPLLRRPQPRPARIVFEPPSPPFADGPSLTCSAWSSSAVHFISS